MTSAMRKTFIGVLAGILLVSGGYAVKTALEFQSELEIYETAQTSFVTVLPIETPLAQAADISAAAPSEDEILIIAEGEIPLSATPDSQLADAQLETQAQPVETHEETPLVIALEPDIAVNFQGLYQVNSDVVAWLYIPNTNINYPVVQGENNQDYLNTTYDGKTSAAGSLFMDYRISGDLTAQNTLIYGHNSSSGAMFGTLDSYEDVSYAQQHPYFFLLTDQGYLRYEICYAMITTATSAVYDLNFSETGTFQSHLDMLDSVALYDLNVAVSETDLLVTLSTCTGVTDDQRFVIVGRLDS